MFYNRKLASIAEIKTSASRVQKIQQNKMLATSQKFANLFLFGLGWQYSSVQTKYDKGISSKSWLLTLLHGIPVYSM